MVGIGIDQIVLPHIDIGGIDAPDEHAGASKVLIPLDALAVLDDKELTLVSSVQAITGIALFKGGYRNRSLSLNECGLGKAQGIALKQAVACRIATVVAPETAGHD